MRVLTPDQIEARAKAKGISMARVLRGADVDQSTWSRNKRGQQNFTTPTYNKIMDSLKKLENACAKTHVRKRIYHE